jgi:integrase
MRAHQKHVSAFQRVGECLYRYSSNGVYYARLKIRGKQIWKSLRTCDRAHAGRELARFKQDQRSLDRSKGKVTLAELCDAYLRTAKHQREKTIARKTLIVRRIKSDWPTGALTQVSQVKPSEIKEWLARYEFGAASRNLHIACIQEILQGAVDDRIITQSPAAAIKRSKLDKPIRKTPSFEEFRAIVASIRKQQFSDTAEESADFVEFLGLAGLGNAEAAALTWDDIDWERGTITTFRHKTKAGFLIPIYPQLRPLLERRRANARGSRVFTVADAKKAIAAACKRLKLPAYSHRAFRRFFVTNALERGVDVQTISRWQGHRDGGKLILSTYGHVRAPHSDRMAALMKAS